jgi:hypothetical protein
MTWRWHEDIRCMIWHGEPGDPDPWLATAAAHWHGRLPGYQPGLGMPPGPEWPEVPSYWPESEGMPDAEQVKWLQYRLALEQQRCRQYQADLIRMQDRVQPQQPVQPPARPEPESLAQRFLPPRWLVTAWMILLLLTGEAFLAVLLGAALRAVGS